MHTEKGVPGHLHSQEYLRSMRTQEDGASEYQLLSQSSLHKKDRRKINQHQKVLTFLEQKSFQLGMSPKPSESRRLIKLIAAIKWKSSMFSRTRLMATSAQHSGSVIWVVSGYAIQGTINISTKQSSWF